jgi:hypothetical protein
MSLEARLEAHHVQIYRDNVQMRAQQLDNPLRAAITEVPASGEAVSASDLVGKVKAIRRTGRDARNIDNVPQNSRRWLLFPTESYSGQHFFTEDKLRQIRDPQSVGISTHTAAVNRDIADKILGIEEVADKTFALTEGGILGGAVDGKGPGGARVQLPARCFTAHGGTGLTLPKLIAAKERLNTDDFGLEEEDPMFCAITPRQVTDLLNIAAQTGASLNQFDIDQLKTGKPTTLLGVTWIRTNRVYKTQAGVRWCPMWSKRNIVMGVWKDISGDIWEDTSMNKTPYGRVNAYVDVVRIEDEGVHVIECGEA